MYRIFLLAFLFLAAGKINAQTYSWSGYPAGGTSYTTGIMTATVTSSSPGFQNGTPKYYSGSTVGSGQCGIAGGLALECMFGNITSAYVTLTIDFTSGNTTNGTCASVQFLIKDINADESYQTFRDYVYISAIDGNNANVPVANITTAGGSNKTKTTSGSSRVVAGSAGSYGSRSQTACDDITVTVTPPSGVPLKRIVIRYQPDYTTCASCYYNWTGPNRPAYQYISIGSLTATASSGCVVLPVELTKFETSCEGENKYFYWETASETNNDFFILEGSKDGKNFISLKQINGAGNSNSVSTYEINITDADNLYSYFRLKQTDFDGHSQYSELRYLNCNDENDIGLFPNPAVSEIILSQRKDENLSSYQIFDMTGRLMKEDALIVSDENKSAIQISDLANGYYSVSLYNFNGERIKSIPFVKQ
jgi:hypothetical protein